LSGWLRQGVPLAIVPIAGDQPYCARRCQALGLGRVIWPADRNAAAIRAAVHTVLGDPTCRDQVRRMRDEACALPPTAAAVTALEQVVNKHAGHRTRAGTIWRYGGASRNRPSGSGWR
jgi:UDP:flavonoid glycosyltransferase YjiC (YdhE family)